MQPKTGFSDQGDLFRSRQGQILNHQQPLYRLADAIDWSLFDREFGTLYVENFGRPGLQIRLLVGLH
jgi:IS5 family transposase